MVVLGIETSCDDTCAAVVDHGRVRSSVVSSQHRFHSPYGGVVPEVAARQHSRYVVGVARAALAEAGVSWGELEGIAVTVAPGLIGALVVGVAFAKGLVLSLGIPLVGVNHLLAHLQTAFLATDFQVEPHVGLLVSGGHTALFMVRAPGEASLMGSTLDDAAGEALDKAAHLLGLGYPGGPALEAAARGGDPHRFPFPRPLLRRGLDFSFSGLKTALAVHVAKHGLPSSAQEMADLAASYQEAVVETLVHKAMEAVASSGVTTLSVTGGVAANQRLRDALSAACAPLGIRLVIPPRPLCTDNAAMVASLGECLLERGVREGLDVDASADVLMGTWGAEDCRVISRGGT